MQRRNVFRLLGLGAMGGVLALLGVMPFDADFCEYRCPICTRARQGNGLARFLQKIEMLVTFGGCPWGRARQRKYGVPPDRPIPLQPKSLS